MGELIRFIKSLKDPCKLCLVNSACIRGTDCPHYLNHVKAKRELKGFAENAGAISLIVLAMFGIVFIFVLIILGLISFHEIISKILGV